jgi:hypothetical protein
MTDGGGEQSWRLSCLSRESLERLFLGRSKEFATMVEWALAGLKAVGSV